MYIIFRVELFMTGVKSNPLMQSAPVFSLEDIVNGVLSQVQTSTEAANNFAFCRNERLHALFTPLPHPSPYRGFYHVDHVFWDAS
jgi:hypothetical protein